MATYPNTVQSKTVFAVGEEFFIHANPKLPALQEGDEVNVQFSSQRDPLGRASVLAEVGNNTYKVRRIE